MALDKNDLQSIKGVVVDVVDTRVSGLEKRIDNRFSKFEKSIDKKIGDFRLEVRDLFKQQGEHLSKAISDAVKLMAESHPTREEFDDLKNEVDDLKEKVNSLLGTSRN